MKHSWNPAFFAALLALTPTLGLAADLEFERTVEADIETLYKIFTTSRGVETFFPGARALIGDAVGEPYQVAFDPTSPDGRENGTFGARILSLQPPHRVSFEWRGPVWASVMNTDPLPTRVEVSLTPEKTGTRVHLRHLGWGQGEQWGKAQAWFARAWEAPLDLLHWRFAAEPVTPFAVESRTLFAFFLLPGENWSPGRPPIEQPRVRNHSAYFGQLRDQGTLMMGGPFLDLDQRDDGMLAMGILQAANVEHAQRLLAADPGIQSGLFVGEVRPWSTTLPESLLGPATDSARSAAGEVGRLAWLAGCWQGEAGEECWLAPRGGMMLGVNRGPDRDDRPPFFELLRVVEEAEGLVLLAQPAGRSPATPFRAVEMGDSRVVFANPEHDFPQRITYWRDGATLKARVEAQRDGEWQGFEQSWSAGSWPGE